MTARAGYIRKNQRKKKAVKLLGILNDMAEWQQPHRIPGGITRYMFSNGFASEYTRALLAAGIIRAENRAYRWDSIKPNLHMAKRIVKDACEYKAAKRQVAKTSVPQQATLEFKAPPPPESSPDTVNEYWLKNRLPNRVNTPKTTTFRLRIFGITIYSLTKTESTK